MTKPKVSVIMPVYNAEKYLREAIDSILSQDFTDFEFLIINDGSTDNSEKIIQSYYDKRIRYIRNESNLKLCTTLNKGFQLANGQYIARIDADDIALSSRLSKQITFLDTHPDIGICGSYIRTFGKTEQIWEYPTTPEWIASELLFHSPICHPAVMIRKSVWIKYNLSYDPKYEYCEDYALWVRASEITQFYNLSEVLLYYRIHNTQITASKASIYKDKIQALRRLQLEKLTITPTDEFLDLLARCAKHDHSTDKSYLIKIEKILLELKQKNQNQKIYDLKIFNEVLFWRCWLPMVRFFWKQTQNIRFLAKFIAFSPFSYYYLGSRLKRIWTKLF